MKQLTIAFTIIIIAIISTFSTIAQFHLKSAIPDEVHLLQNPFKPMNILIIPANIDGVKAQQGDLVMAFDGEVCVGATAVEDVEKVLNLVATSTDEINKGYRAGQAIRLEYHSLYDNAIYDLSPTKIMLGNMNFEELSTLYADFKATTLNINEINRTPEIKVYPNPVSQQLHIVLESKKTSSGEYMNLKLFNLAGHTVIAKEIITVQSIINLDVASLPAGIYTLHLFNSNSNFIQKVIKK